MHIELKQGVSPITHVDSDILSVDCPLNIISRPSSTQNVVVSEIKQWLNTKTVESETQVTYLAYEDADKWQICPQENLLYTLKNKTFISRPIFYFILEIYLIVNKLGAV